MNIPVATPETLRQVIDLHGVAGVTVLDDDECDELFDELLTFVENATSAWDTPFSRSNKATWKQYFNLAPLHGYLIQCFGIGNSPAVWLVRQNPKIVALFATFYDVKPSDLLTSFDGASLLLPPEDTGRGFYKGKDWYHCDQSFTERGFQCVQSWVTAKEVRSGDATLTYLKDSHMFHDAFALEFKVSKKTDWFKLTPEHMAWYEAKGCVKVDVVCPKGTVVFWDSRTIHCGKGAIKGRETPDYRAIVYAYFMPRSAASDKDLKRKREAFDCQRTTTHLAKTAKLFATKPRFFKADNITMPPRPAMSLLGAKLAGF